MFSSPFSFSHLHTCTCRMPSLLRSSAVAGAVVAVAVAAVLCPTAPGAELTTSWLKLTALERASPYDYLSLAWRRGDRGWGFAVPIVSLLVYIF